jgi:thiamine transporter ThiT
MNRQNYVLAFIAAVLFAIASILSFINGSTSRGAIAAIGAIAFVLAGLEWRRRKGKGPGGNG